MSKNPKYLCIVFIVALTDQHHRLQHPSPGLPQPEHEPAERRTAAAQRGRRLLQGATTRPHQHASQLGHGAHSHAAHARVSEPSRCSLWLC